MKLTYLGITKSISGVVRDEHVVREFVEKKKRAAKTKTNGKQRGRL